MEPQENTTQTYEQETPLVYEINSLKAPLWYDFAPLGSVVLMTVAVLILCIGLFLDPNPIPKLCAVVCFLAFALYIARFLYHFLRSRKLVTREAILTDTDLTVTNAAWSKRLLLEDVVFTMSYSSSTNLCIIVATKDDYVTISCSCGFLLAKNGKAALRPFYALNKRLMQWNPNHYNYVKNKRYKRKNPYKVPLYVFEVEYDTPRVTKFIDSLRPRYPFCWAQRSLPEEAEET